MTEQVEQSDRTRRYAGLALAGFVTLVVSVLARTWVRSVLDDSGSSVSVDAALLVDLVAFLGIVGGLGLALVSLALLSRDLIRGR